MAKDALGHGSEKHGGGLTDTQAAIALGHGHPKSEQVPIHDAHDHVYDDLKFLAAKNKNYLRGAADYYHGGTEYHQKFHEQTIAPELKARNYPKKLTPEYHDFQKWVVNKWAGK